MAKKETYTCDSCGIEKSETNHWFMVRVRIVDCDPSPMVSNTTLTGFIVFPWESGNRDQSILHLCGQGCIVRKLSEWMGELNN